MMETKKEVKTMNEIEKYLKKYEKSEDAKESSWITEDMTGNYKPTLEPTLQVKASQLAEVGVLHLQFSCPDIEALHEDMRENLGTQIADGNGILRDYGVAFNIRVPNLSLDQTLLKQLGQSIGIENDDIPKVCSFASNTVDYVKMSYRGVVEAKDNNPERNIVQALDFRVGHEDHRVCVGFSNMAPMNGEWELVPHLNPVWFLAWLASRYLVKEEEE